MASGNGNRRIHMSLPCTLDLLGVVDKVIEGITERMEFEDTDRDAIAISVIEASTNAIQHGHAEDGTAQYQIDFEMAENKLIILVHDRGTGFEPDMSSDLTPPDLLSTRGRGIFIMRSMMDEVSFDFTNGTLVRLVKNRSESEGGGEADA